MQLFCGKKLYSVIRSLHNIPSMQRYVLIILRQSRLARRKGVKNVPKREHVKVFSRVCLKTSVRLTCECRKISNLIQHTRNVATAQSYNSRKFGLKM